MLNFQITDDRLVIFDNGIPKVIDKNNYKYDIMLSYFRQKRSESEILDILNSENELNLYVKLGLLDILDIRGDTLYFEDEVFPDVLWKQIIKHYNAGLDHKYILRFLQKLRKNPSKRIINRLYDFIQESVNSGGFAISEDGNIIAYKKVRNDYKDIHSGTFSNKIGNIVSMPRNNVDDDCQHTCSSGLHFCAYSYLSHFGENNTDRIMLISIDPADVVSIPIDYNDAKGRCCKYKVIAELPKNNEKPIEDIVLIETEEETDIFFENLYNKIQNDYLECINAMSIYMNTNLKLNAWEIIDESVEKLFYDWYLYLKSCKHDELIEIYNCLNSENKIIKKFRNKNTAIMRIMTSVYYYDFDNFYSMNE